MFFLSTFWCSKTQLLGKQPIHHNWIILADEIIQGIAERCDRAKYEDRRSTTAIHGMRIQL